LKNINICFEYLLQGEGIIYYDELVERNKFKNIHKSIQSLANEWYFENGVDITLYKGFSVGEILSYELTYSKVNTIIFLMMLFSETPKILKIYKTKEFKINNVIIDILNSVNVEYEIIIINKKCVQELVPLSESVQELFTKRYIRQIIVFLNNFIKNFKKTERCYFQGYSTTLDLIKYFDNKIVTDQIPKNIKNIFSINRPFYFIPKILKKEKKEIPFIFKNTENIYSIIKDIFYNHYLNNQEEIHFMIDSIIENFKRYYITKAIIMTPNARIPSIIKQYMKQTGGTVALYNHGVINYTNQKEYLQDIDNILSWNNYETEIYKSFGKNVINTGFPRFNKLNNHDKKYYNEERDFYKLKVSILAIATSENYDMSRRDIVKIHKNLIKMLIKIGFQTKNIRFIIHPGRANKEFYLEVYKNYILAKNIIKNMNIIDVIKSSDILIGGASTVIYEATYLNTPYYTYEPNSCKFSGEDKIIFTKKYINTATTLNGLEQNIINSKSQDIKIFKEKALYLNNYQKSKDIIYKKFLTCY